MRELEGEEPISEEYLTVIRTLKEKFQLQRAEEVLVKMLSTPSLASGVRIII